MPDPSLPPSAVDAVIAWYRRCGRDLPWRRAEFHARWGAWGVLVSEFMLLQTPTARVAPRLARWLERWPTPTETAAATPADVLAEWDNLGYPRRALWLHTAATRIRDEHGGVVPDDVDALRALPGIGDYTARAVAVFAYGRRHPVVDTNTRRVIARAVQGLSQPGPASPRDLTRMAALLPATDEESAAMNAAMMELGATVCIARTPRCEKCPITEWCRWRADGYPDTGDTRRRQARYEGSDRQARGAVLAQLRDAHRHILPVHAVIADWPDPDQRDRAIRSLGVDGLVREQEGMLLLPR